MMKVHSSILLIMFLSAVLTKATSDVNISEDVNSTTSLTTAKTLETLNTTEDYRQTNFEVKRKRSNLYVLSVRLTFNLVWSKEFGMEKQFLASFFLSIYLLDSPIHISNFCSLCTLLLIICLSNLCHSFCFF